MLRIEQFHYLLRRLPIAMMTQLAEQIGIIQEQAVFQLKHILQNACHCIH